MQLLSRVPPCRGVLHLGRGSSRRLPRSSRSSDGLRKDDPTFSARARLVIGRDAWRLDDTGPAAEFADRLDNALRDAPGRTGAPLAAPYWMEAPLFAAAGIPVVICGPSGGGLHAVDEWVDLRQVRAYAAGLVTAFREYAEAGGPAH